MTSTGGRPPFSWWQDRKSQLKLSIKGGELTGPCPSCHGKDRFHVRKDGLFGCRKCRKFLEILEVAGWKRRPTPDHTYPYALATGGTATVQRWDALHGKSIRQSTGTKGDALPYRHTTLAGVPADQVIWIVEGEKCADRLRDMDAHATTYRGGMGNWRKTDWSILAGKQVALWPDAHDGDAFRELAAHLADICEIVRWYEPPADKPMGWDAADATDAELEAAFKGALDIPHNGDARKQGEGDGKPNKVRQLGPLEISAMLEPQWTGFHCYTPGRGWYCRIEGQTWEPDVQGLGLHRAIQSQLEPLRADGKVPAGIRATSVITDLKPRLAYTADWDADSFTAGLPDGRVLNLKTGEVRVARPDDRISRRLGARPVRPDNGQCPPHWDNVIGHVCEGDGDEYAWLHRWCGYMLTGSTREAKFLFLQGAAGGGKSIFIKTLAKLMGTYTAGLPQDALTSDRQQHPEWLARLAGVRAVMVPELDSGAWRSAILKSLVSGDALTAREMRESSFDFTPVAKLVVGGNRKPALPRGDSGMRRRLVLVPVAPVPKADRDGELQDKLLEELPQIMFWALDGLAAYLSDGLPELPTRWRGATSEYFATEDVIGQWIANCTRREPGNFVPSQAIVDSYNAFSGQRIGRMTPIVEWLVEHNETEINPDRRRPAPGENPKRGLTGIVLNSG